MSEEFWPLFTFANIGAIFLILDGFYGTRNRFLVYAGIICLTFLWVVLLLGLLGVFKDSREEKE